MAIDPISNNAAAREVQREALVMKKQQDVAKEVAASLVDLVKETPKPAPGRVDTYA